MCCNLYARAETVERFTLAFYNLENMFDTLPSPNGEGGDFTPEGKFAWNTQRYNSKIQNLSRVIDQINADVLGVSEIESEQAARDLVMGLKTDYNYLFVDSGDKRGVNFALFYKGDKFTPHKWHRVRSGSSRQFMRVRGSLDELEVNIIVCHLASNFNSEIFRSKVFMALRLYVDQLLVQEPHTPLIVMGDFNARSKDKIFKENFGAKAWTKDQNSMFNPFEKLDAKGFGTCAYDNRWLLYDNILFDSSLLKSKELRYLDCGIFIRDYMLSSKNDPKAGYPLRSFYSGQYLNGYSDHLPVWAIVERWK